MSRTTLACLVTAALTIAQPAHAASEAEAALIGAVIGQALSGKTTLADKAGEIEGWMVAAPLLESAALAIKGKIDVSTGILLVGAEAPNLGLPATIIAQIDKFDQEFNLCVPKLSAKGFVSDPVTTSIAAAVSGAPASETKISGYILEPNDQALVNAMLGAPSSGWTRLEDLFQSKVDPSIQVQSRWVATRIERYKFAKTTCGKSDVGKALIARFDALDTKYTTAGDKGEASVLDQATRIQAALDNRSHALRVHIVKAGGSVINSDNFLTRLGAPAVSVTGAVVIGYRLIDIATGESTKAGLVVCYSPRKQLRDIHEGVLPVADSDRCKPKTPKKKENS